MPFAFSVQIHLFLDAKIKNSTANKKQCRIFTRINKTIYFNFVLFSIVTFVFKLDFFVMPDNFSNARV